MGIVFFTVSSLVLASLFVISALRKSEILVRFEFPAVDDFDRRRDDALFFGLNKSFSMEPWTLMRPSGSVLRLYLDIDLLFPDELSLIHI